MSIFGLKRFQKTHRWVPYFKSDLRAYRRTEWGKGSIKEIREIKEKCKRLENNKFYRLSIKLNANSLLYKWINDNQIRIEAFIALFSISDVLSTAIQPFFLSSEGPRKLQSRRSSGSRRARPRRSRWRRPWNKQTTMVVVYGFYLIAFWAVLFYSHKKEKGYKWKISFIIKRSKQII